MGRKKVSEPRSEHLWLLREIEEINAMPRSGWDKNQKTRNRSLLANRRNLRRIIKIAVAASKGGYIVGHVVHDSLLIEINSKHEIELFRDGLIHRIIDEKVPVERLRICPACDLIFWMKTKRSKTCGRKECPDRAYYLTNKKGK